MDNNLRNRAEKKLVKKIHRGDKDVFKYLFDNYYHRLFLYAKSYIEETEIAEDIVQDLFYTLWEKHQTILITTSLSSYLFRAVHNRCIQFLRHQSVINNFNEKQQFKLKEALIVYNTAKDFTFSEIQLNEIQKIIKSTLEELPEKTRDVFIMSREELLTNKEVSIKMNINIKTVEYHMSIALKNFRNALKDFFG